ncbi:hypothetical protein T4B_14588 [Trichinella pseudospiralis]|uniref:Uncharacterized protein n=1 Tax=Trichinella pseudospiralis TaxID=6337 RepID=A0A0V1IKN4_TRIPS|nr:hypothetical protein T4B_14588 [Trichinella pseudospiralis]
MELSVLNTFQIQLLYVLQNVLDSKMGSRDFFPVSVRKLSTMIYAVEFHHLNQINATSGSARRRENI